MGYPEGPIGVKAAGVPGNPVWRWGGWWLLPSWMEVWGGWWYPPRERYIYIYIYICIYI